MPEIFMDTSFAVAQHYNLSTSQACLRSMTSSTSILQETKIKHWGGSNSALGSSTGLGSRGSNSPQIPCGELATHPGVYPVLLMCNWARLQPPLCDRTRAKADKKKRGGGNDLRNLKSCCDSFANSFTGASKTPAGAAIIAETGTRNLNAVSHRTWPT